MTNLNGTTAQILWAENIITDACSLAREKVAQCESKISYYNNKPVRSGREARRAVIIDDYTNLKNLWETALTNLQNQTDALTIIDNIYALVSDTFGSEPAVLETNLKRRGTAWARLANNVPLYKIK